MLIEFLQDKLADNGSVNKQNKHILISFWEQKVRQIIVNYMNLFRTLQIVF